MASQPSLDACGRSRSTLSSGLWGTRTRSPLLSALPLKQNLRLHSLRIVARVSSSPGVFHPHNPFQASREKTCLEFILPSSVSYRIAERWVCNGGGKRPRKPRMWRTRHRKGSYSKSDKLLEYLEPVSNVKEEVYGALDSFIAWELDFPLIAVKKALHVLVQQQNWTRVIQVIKWMLGKGQGRSLGNYQLLLQAFSEEGRIDEAKELWEKVFNRNLECTPIKLFAEVMRMYDRYEMYEDLLDVFADMEELNVQLNAEIAGIVSAAYEKVGSLDKAEKVRQKYLTPPPKFRWRTINGRNVKFRNVVERGPSVSRWVRADDTTTADKSDLYDGLRVSQNVEEDGSNDDESEHDEEFLTEGNLEDSHFQGVDDMYANVGRFPSKQLVKDEVYM